MTVRINTNAMALNTHRNVVNNSKAQAKNLEKLSSGLKINRAADAPAALNISEQLRAQTASLKQAIDNTEMSVSLMQTAEAALDEVSRSLISARQIAVHAANTATNDEFMHTADQQEIDSILSEINTIAANTQYGKNFLLDGSRAGNGITTGEHLQFLDADHRASSSGPGGHEVKISKAATRSEVTGSVALSQEIIEQGEQITITEGGRTVNFRTITNANVEQNMNELALAIEEAGLNVELVRPDTSDSDGFAPQAMTLRHKNYGSEHSFQVTTNTAGLFSSQSNVPDWIQNGIDVQGEIAGEESIGRGQVLTGGVGAGVAEGIRVLYTGEKAPERRSCWDCDFHAELFGIPYWSQCSSPDESFIQQRHAATLGIGIDNQSDFKSLADISVMDGQKAMDAMQIIDRAIEEVAANRGRMGAFQKNTLESNLNFLRIAHENVLSSESVIRDADMATEMANFTRNQILMDSSVAMLAQANQAPMAMLQLLQ